MKTYETIIAIDVSGNWNKNEKGGTGIAFIGGWKKIEDLTVWAKDYSSKIEYWEAIFDKLWIEEDEEDDTLVIIEDFKLQGGKASTMTNQQMQTSELIGFLEAKLDELGITHVRQANTIKSRWPKKLLTEEIEAIFGIKDYKPSSRHAVDAVRHLITAWLKMTPKDEGGFGTPYKELEDGK